ncbi:hypothetical protein SV7mr_03560 [Stieleria bergensis]|uniref:Uncharacterized protein n=1 Tax=Stieleria bergensis TaxID=2528025 RepID=A0A517SP28_9BACT|nr:hypothetical protein SV7mr_03560 [Planctomycetes bacterium SV_7m_r]
MGSETAEPPLSARKSNPAADDFAEEVADTADSDCFSESQLGILSLPGDRQRSKTSVYLDLRLIASKPFIAVRLASKQAARDSDFRPTTKLSRFLTLELLKPKSIPSRIVVAPHLPAQLPDLWQLRPAEAIRRDTH